MFDSVLQDRFGDGSLPWILGVPSQWRPGDTRHLSCPKEAQAGAEGTVGMMPPVSVFPRLFHGQPAGPQDAGPLQGVTTQAEEESAGTAEPSTSPVVPFGQVLASSVQVCHQERVGLSRCSLCSQKQWVSWESGFSCLRVGTASPRPQPCTSCCRRPTLFDLDHSLATKLWPGDLDHKAPSGPHCPVYQSERTVQPSPASCRPADPGLSHSTWHTGLHYTHCSLAVQGLPAAAWPKLTPTEGGICQHLPNLYDH